MKRQSITLEQIANYSNLILAVYKASKGKKHRRAVQNFHKDFDHNIRDLSKNILQEKLPYGRFKSFIIHDPKTRVIHAACFEDRIFHHAVMNIAGERLEESMVVHSYACRPNKGVHRAIKQVRHNLQRYNFFVKIDIAAYFTNIDHEILLELLERRFKGREFMRQLYRLVKSCPEMNNKGLPIGSLSSQYFANYYLDGLDRYLASHPNVNANIRYMDDVIWWCETKQQAKQTLQGVVNYLQDQRKLLVKPTIQILPSYAGVTYCGFRISKGVVRLSRRRKKTINKRRYFWEQEYLQNNISASQLQTAYAAVHSVMQGTDSLAWRKKQLQVKPPIEV